jgi:hypothetical protein
VKLFKSSLCVVIFALASPSFAGTASAERLPVGKRIGETILICGPEGIMVTGGATAGTIVGGTLFPFFILGSDIVAGRMPDEKDLGEYKDMLKEPLSAIQSVWEDCGKMAIHGETSDN